MDTDPLPPPDPRFQTTLPNVTPAIGRRTVALAIAAAALFVLLALFGAPRQAHADPGLVVAVAEQLAQMSAADITNVRARPVKAAQFDGVTRMVGLTPLTLTASDVAAASRADAEFAQVVKIWNRSTTLDVCVKPVAFATSCVATCAAASFACGVVDGGVHLETGLFLPPNFASDNLVVQGDVCICGVASAAGPAKVSAVRVQRAADQ